MAGDKLDILGKSYYVNTTQVTNANSTALSITQIMTSLLLGPANPVGAKGATATDLTNLNTGQIPSSFIRGSNSEAATTVPKAYINYILLDDQFKYAGGGASRVGTSGVVKDHWTNGLQNINVTKSGYLFVYVSNESNFNVFFDNLQVVHTRGPILEETHYYPFGLIMAGISCKAAGSIENKYKYNKGSEIQNGEFTDGSGLEMYYTHFRQLDPQLGRWWQLDPKPNMGESPYSTMGNNPILKNDPLGDTTIVDMYGNIKRVYGTSNLVFMQSGKSLKPIGEIGGKIDANEIITNLLRTHKQFAKGMGMLAWIQKVLPGHDWDLKANTNTIYGAAWKYDREHASANQSKTMFIFGSNTMNAADVGNYHAGYTGTIAGVPAETQYTLAGLGEVKKDVDKSSFGSALERFSQIFSMQTGAPSFPGVVSNYTRMSKPMAPYGDQQRDYEMNTLGMQDADSGK